MSKEKYMDASLSPQERAKELLAKMSIEQKFAQLQCSMNFKDIGKSFPHGIGQVSIVACGAQTAEELASAIAIAQMEVISNNEFGIPAIFHAEALAGGVFPGATVYQSGIGQAATWDPECVKEMADIARKQLCAVGIRQALAPVMDISRDPRWGRMGETYGEDPALASAMGVAFTKGMQGEDLTGGVVATAKHFLGYGYPEGGMNMAACDIPERMMREVFAAPFQAAISEAGLQSVMNSYSSINGEPVISSKKILTDLLRDEMGFNGVVVSDYMSILWLTLRFKTAVNLIEAGKQAMIAGLDIECPNPAGYTKDLIEEVKAGRLDETLIDRSCLRVLEAKFKLGLFDNPYPQKEMIPEVFNNTEHENACLEASKKSLVLYKNDGILPLSKDIKKIALIGPHIDSVRMLFGCYTYPCFIEMGMGMAGGMIGADMDFSDFKNEPKHVYPGSKVAVEDPALESILRKLYPKSHSVRSAIEKLCPDSQMLFAKGFDYTGTDKAGFTEALAMAEDADVVIVSIGGKYGWGNSNTMGEGIDSTNIGLPGVQEDFVREIAAVNNKIVAIHFDGRPLSSEFVEENFSAILECWSPGMFGGEAIASVLFGDYNPGGKLPLTTVRCAGQIPMYYYHENGSGYPSGLSAGYSDMENKPLYHFGYGLSYTQFEYSNLVIEGDKVTGSDRIKVSIDVKNIGEVVGDEVVQLYIKDLICSMVRPNKLLAGFARITLAPSEKKNVCFELPVSQLAFLDSDMKWKVEAGDMEAQVGSSSNDIRLKAPFIITSDAFVDGKTRGFYASVSLR